MNKLLLIILTFTLAVTVSARDVEIVMTREITQDQTNLIPAKTDEFKLQNYQIVVQGDMQNVYRLMEELSKEDYEHNVFKLEIYQEEGKLHFEIKDFDPMYESKNSRDVMLGVIRVSRSYFIVDKSSNSSIYKKDKNKTKFVREFELVATPRANDESHIIGVVDNGTINFNKYVLDGENKLQPAVVEEPERLDYIDGNGQEQEIKAE